MNENELIKLEEIFKMFGNKARLKILFELHKGEKTVNELAEAGGLKQSATSHQLKDMKASRLIKSQKRGLNVFYSLCDQHIIEILRSAFDHISQENCKED